MITTNNKEFFKLCKRVHDHGHENNPNFQEEATRIEFRLIFSHRINRIINSAAQKNW